MNDPLDATPLFRAIYRYARFGETTPAEEFEAAVADADVVIARMDYGTR